MSPTTSERFRIPGGSLDLDEDHEEMPQANSASSSSQFTLAAQRQSIVHFTPRYLYQVLSWIPHPAAAQTAEYALAMSLSGNAFLQLQRSALNVLANEDHLMTEELVRVQMGVLPCAPSAVVDPPPHSSQQQPENSQQKEFLTQGTSATTPPDTVSSFGTEDIDSSHSLPPPPIPRLPTTPTPLSRSGDSSESLDTVSPSAPQDPDTSTNAISKETPHAPNAGIPQESPPSSHTVDGEGLTEPQASDSSNEERQHSGDKEPRHPDDTVPTSCAPGPQAPDSDTTEPRDSNTEPQHPNDVVPTLAALPVSSPATTPISEDPPQTPTRVESGDTSSYQSGDSARPPNPEPPTLDGLQGTRAEPAQESSTSDSTTPPNRQAGDSSLVASLSVEHAEQSSPSVPATGAEPVQISPTSDPTSPPAPDAANRHEGVVSPAGHTAQQSSTSIPATGAEPVQTSPASDPASDATVRRAGDSSPMWWPQPLSPPDTSSISAESLLFMDAPQAGGNPDPSPAPLDNGGPLQSGSSSSEHQTPDSGSSSSATTSLLDTPVGPVIPSQAHDADGDSFLDFDLLQFSPFSLAANLDCGQITSPGCVFSSTAGFCPCLITDGVRDECLHTRSAMSSDGPPGETPEADMNGDATLASPSCAADTCRSPATAEVVSSHENASGGDEDVDGTFVSQKDACDPDMDIEETPDSLPQHNDVDDAGCSCDAGQPDESSPSIARAENNTGTDATFSSSSPADTVAEGGSNLVASDEALDETSSQGGRPSGDHRPSFLGLSIPVSPTSLGEELSQLSPLFSPTADELWSPTENLVNQISERSFSVPRRPPVAPVKLKRERRKHRSQGTDTFDLSSYSPPSKKIVLVDVAVQTERDSREEHLRRRINALERKLRSVKALSEEREQETGSLWKRLVTTDRAVPAPEPLRLGILSKLNFSFNASDKSSA